MILPMFGPQKLVLSHSSFDTKIRLRTSNFHKTIVIAPLSTYVYLDLPKCPSLHKTLLHISRTVRCRQYNFPAIFSDTIVTVQ